MSLNESSVDSRRQARIYVGIVGLYVVLLTWWIIYFSNQGDLLVQRILRNGTQLSPVQAQAVHDAAHESLRMFIFEGAFLGVLLLASVWFVVRAMRREILLHRQQSNFVSAVTHELRSPIASAQLYIDSILMGRTDEARSARYLRHAREDLERLSAMVEQILLVRRIARTGVMLAPEPSDLVTLVSHWAGRQDSLAERGVELRVQAEGSVPVSVDPELFEKVVDNLVSNAVKYGGEQPIDVAVGIDEGSAVVTVRDHGLGLQGADPRRLRQAFVRGGDEDVRTRPGVGLGLYIVGQIIEAHGGRFDLADADDGPGAVARVEVPLVDASLLDSYVSGREAPGEVGVDRRPVAPASSTPRHEEGPR